jgi:hypothetical protein
LRVAATGAARPVEQRASRNSRISTSAQIAHAALAHRTRDPDASRAWLRSRRHARNATLATNGSNRDLGSGPNSANGRDGRGEAAPPPKNNCAASSVAVPRSLV